MSYICEIISTLKNNTDSKPVTSGTIFKMLCNSMGEKVDKDSFNRAIKFLKKQGIFHKSGGKYSFKRNLCFISGKIFITSRGYSFVAIKEGKIGGNDDKDVFIPPGRSSNAFNGDIVFVAVTEPENKKGPAGIVIDVIERKTESFTGVVYEEYDGFYLRPVLTSVSAPMKIIDGDTILDNGDWITAEFISWEKFSDNIVVKMTSLLEKESKVSNILDAIMLDYELPSPFSPEDTELSSFSPVLQDDESFERKDLLSTHVITIDPFDAKDYDDALSIMSETAKTITVGIHIADIASYIPKDSHLDKIAMSRAFTNYLPGRTIPMLPTKFTAEASLNEGEVKAAHTVTAKIDKKTGEILKIERFHSTIKVTKRLNFDQVQAFIDNVEHNTQEDHEKGAFSYETTSFLPMDESTDKDISHLDKDVTEVLKKLIRLYHLLRVRRKKREQFIMLGSHEVRVVCSERPSKIKGFRNETHNESSCLIEEFMLLANSAVADELIKRRIPGLFRVHNEPPPEDLDEFIGSTRNLIRDDPGKLNNRKKINNLFERDLEPALMDVVISFFLKAMQRAEYSSKPSLHYGLGKEKYSHFTSPIRRYADLLVHQQLSAIDGDNHKNLRSNTECERIGIHCTEVEAKYDEAYRSASDKLKLFYLSQQLQEGALGQFEAIVCGINNSSLKLYIMQWGMMGSLPYSNLDDYYVVNREKNATRGKRGKKYKLGDYVYVFIADADPFRDELIFKPVML